MDVDKSIQEALAIGQKNKATMALVRNWCKHASVRKTGGMGLVEQMSGLPIGHMSVECPHAPAGGMATWDLVDAAIDFHDRNCAQCTQRKPVGLPNLSKLIGERNTEATRRKRESDEAEAKLREELEARDRVRDALRSTLTTVQVTVVDQIRALDHTPSEASAQALAATASMAPDHFPASVVNHLFDLALKGSHHCVQGCFDALVALQADPKRLCALALQLLGRYSLREQAAAVVERHADLAESNLIGAAVPALISLANPRYYPMMGSSSRINPSPAALFALYRHHANDVKAALESLLNTRSANRVEAAARGIRSLAAVDPQLPLKFARDLVAKLARARHLLPDLDSHDPEPAGNIRSAVVAAYRQNPPEVDAILQSYFMEADDQSKAAVIEVYRDVFRRTRADGETELPGEPERIAFSRIIWTSTMVETPEALRFLQYAMHGDLSDLTPSPEDEIDNLLGAAAVIDDKVQRLKKPAAPTLTDPTPEPARDYLRVMERQNTISMFQGIQSTFARWACEASGAAGPTRVAKLVEFGRQLPDDRDDLRAALLGNYDHAAVSAETLNVLLPELYAALVGPSPVLRSTAATILGELPRARLNQLPDLVFEAFIPLLTDSFVIVHRAAVRALHRISVPPAFGAQVRDGLVLLIECYRRHRSNDAFLLDCLQLLGDRYPEDYPYDGRYGRIVFAELMTCAVLEVGRDVRAWAYRLRAYPQLPELLVRLLGDDESYGTYRKDVFALFDQLTVPQIKACAAQLIACGRAEASHEQGWPLPVINALSRAQLWDEAVTVAQLAHDAIPSELRVRPSRLSSELVLHACRYEQAIASGRLGDLQAIAEQWRAADLKLKKDEEEYAEQRDPLRGFRRTN